MIDAANMEYYNKPLPAMSTAHGSGKQKSSLCCFFADMPIYGYLSSRK